MRHIEPFLHGGDAADDAFVLRPPIFSTTLIQRPYLYITKRPLFSGSFGKSLKVHYILGKLRTFLTYCKLKSPFIEMLPPIFGQICMLSPKDPCCLLVPSLWILRVHEYQPYPIINLINIMYTQAVPKKLVPISGSCIFHSSNKYYAIFCKNNYNFFLAFRGILVQELIIAFRRSLRFMKFEHGQSEISFAL